MANLITLVRFVLLFPLIVMAYNAPPPWQLIDAPLLILIMALDGLDGYVARKRDEATVFGSIFDVAIDRVLDIRHNSRLDLVDAAFAKLGLRVKTRILKNS